MRLLVNVSIYCFNCNLCLYDFYFYVTKASVTSTFMWRTLQWRLLLCDERFSDFCSATTACYRVLFIVVCVLFYDKHFQDLYKITCVLCDLSFMWLVFYATCSLCDVSFMWLVLYVGGPPIFLHIKTVFTTTYKLLASRLYVISQCHKHFSVFI